jgi:ribosomal-protein-alanine acetyltransferase
MGAKLAIGLFQADDIDRVLPVAAAAGLSPWSEDDYHDELHRADSYMAIAETSGEVAGFYVARRVPGDKPGRWDAELYNIAVVAKQRRSGVGSMLLEHLLGRLSDDKVDSLWLEVRSKNQSAVEFYTNKGFIFSYLRRNFYQAPPDDAIVMVLQLSTELPNNNSGNA